VAFAQLAIQLVRGDSSIIIGNLYEALDIIIVVMKRVTNQLESPSFVPGIKDTFVFPEHFEFLELVIKHMRVHGRTVTRDAAIIMQVSELMFDTKVLQVGSNRKWQRKPRRCRDPLDCICIIMGSLRSWSYKAADIAVNRKT
jgi:hypothetical protein